MVDPNKADRMYNHFTTDGVKSDATKHIWDAMNDEFGADEDLDMSTVWVKDKDGVERFVPPKCFVPAPDSQFCGWNQITEDVFFDLIGSLTNSRGMSDFISVISIIALIIYFVTSSDSGSLVVDIIAANGEEEPPIPQRVFWAFTEGACCIALLYSGKDVLGPFGDPGQGGLRACQAASIIVVLPYTFLLFWYCQALVQVVREEGGELDPERPRFKMFLLSLPRSDVVTLQEGLLMLVRNTFLPGLCPAVKHATLTWPFGGVTSGVFWMVLLQLMYIGSVITDCLGVMEYSIFTMSLAIFTGFGAFLSLVRREIRKQWGIPRGDFLTDFMWSLIAYMFVLTQIEIEMKHDKKKDNNLDRTL